MSEHESRSRQKRRQRWIFEVGWTEEAAGPEIDLTPLENAMGGLDLTLTDRETAISGSSVLVYCLGHESDADQYLARVEEEFPAPRFQVSRRLEKPKKRTTAAQRVKPVPGDVFAVPLPGRQYGYVYVVEESPSEYAHPVEFLDLVTTDRLASIEECKAAPPMMAPILTVIEGGLRNFGWVRVGSTTRSTSTVRFRQSLGHALTGWDHDRDWELWEAGVGWQPVGLLPDSLRPVPIFTHYSPLVIAGKLASAKGIPDDGSLGVDLSLWAVA